METGARGVGVQELLKSGVTINGFGGNRESSHCWCLIAAKSVIGVGEVRLAFF